MFLVFLPFELVDGMARVWLLKSLYMSISLPLWSTTGPGTILVTPLAVCAGVHAHSLVSCLCGSMLGLGPFGGSARLILIISSQFLLFANLPDGNATWHNPMFGLCVCRDQEMIKMKFKIILNKHFMKINLCSLEHFICL
jgi:hypothetical protein